MNQSYKNIAFGMPVNQIDEDGLQEVIKITKLDKFVADLPNGLNTMAGEKGVRLSGGQKTKDRNSQSSLQ